MIEFGRTDLEACYCEGERAKFSIVSEVIREYGFAVLPSYFDPETTRNLRDETLRVLDGDVGRKQIFGDSLVQFSSMDELATLDVPTIMRCSEDRLFKAMGDDFFDPFESICIGATVHNDREKSVYNHHFHWDPGITIKAFTYLTDVGLKHGALNVCPRSHHDGFYRKLFYAPQGRKSYLTFIPEDEINIAHPIQGSAGTVILFNTNTFHRAGAIESGHDRIVIRYHYGTDRRKKHDEEACGHIEQCFNPKYMSQAYEKPLD